MKVTVSTIDQIVQDKNDSKAIQLPTHFEEALELTGYGIYNYSLMIVCSMTLLAMGMDLYGMSIVVPASACDFNLTVSQRGILSAISFMGVIVSSHTWGYLSDTRGRRSILMLSMWVGFVLAFLSGLSPNWIVMAVLKFFASAFTSAANSCVYTLLGECSPAHARNLLLLTMASFLTLAQGVTAILAWRLLPLPFATPIYFLGITYRPWRLLLQLLASVCGLCAFSLQFFHESPRFLASQGRIDEALAVLQKIYATNTGDKAENYPVREIHFNSEEVSKPSSVLRSMWEQTVPLFKRPLLANTIKIFYLGIVVTSTIAAFVMWYPAIMNSYLKAEASETASANNICGTFSIEGVTLLHGNNTIIRECDDTIQDTTVYAVAGLSFVYVVLSIAIALLVRWTGKKAIVILVLTLSSLSGIICNLVYNPTIGIVLLFIFYMEALVIGTISAFCVDLFPTKVRGMAVCLYVMISRTSAFIGIYTVGLLLAYNCELAFYIFGALSLSGVVAAFLLPSESALRKSNEVIDG